MGVWFVVLGIIFVGGDGFMVVIRFFNCDDEMRRLMGGSVSIGVLRVCGVEWFLGCNRFRDLGLL